ncbi:MAG TPA: alpha/beta fold hydrolase [Acidimicrobiales bacterium]|nr:alpha/beta fold hydrolase [Acidimicrobiales bacterium]
MWLHAERDGTGPRLVLVHGFTQTGRCWGPVAEDLATDHEVVRVDAPGHGRSSDVVAGLRGGGRLIADQGGEATYLGYSMGGRHLLHLALANPELVRGLVLLGATAGIDDPGERAARAEADRQTSARLRELGLLDFLREWVAQPMFAGIPPERQYLVERMEGTVDGLEASLLQAGTGAQDPSWDRLHRLDMPVLVLAGEHDEKYVELGRRMDEAIGANSTFATVAGAGHAAHLEQPDAFLAVLRPWLAAHDL